MDKRRMALLAGLLIALGLSTPVLTIYLVHAAPRLAGYESGTGYLISILAIIWVVVQARSMAQGRRVRAYFLVAAIVMVVNLWSSYRIIEDARIDRQIVAARPQINAIMQAAAAEATLINSGESASVGVSPGWQPYAAGRAIDLGDSAVPLSVRFIELMRRAKSRELDLARKLREEVDASGIGTALSPGQLISAEGRAGSLAGAARYRDFMESYVRRLEGLNDQADADIRALELPRASQDQLIGGRVRAKGENAAEFEQLVGRELQTIDSVEAVIRFVDAHADAAHVEEGQIVFSDPAVQADYEAMLVRLGLVGG